MNPLAKAPSHNWLRNLVPTSVNSVGNPRQCHLNRWNLEEEQMNLVTLGSQLS